MDSNQFLKYGLNDADLSYGLHPHIRNLANYCYSHPALTSSKFALDKSPISPLLSQFDCDSPSVLSNYWEHLSSETSTALSPSQYSSLESDSSFRLSRANFGGSTWIESASPYTVGSRSMKHALQEIETVLMAPDTDEPTTSSKPESNLNNPPNLTKQSSRTWSHESGPGSPALLQPQYVPSRYPNTAPEVPPDKRPREMRELPDINVKQLLLKCAEALYEDKNDEFEVLVEKASNLVSISGEPIQRLGAYMLEGLVARRESSGTNIYRALKCREPESKELLSYMRILYDICPYFKFGYMAANGAIAEALRTEDRIHIIDFQIAQGTQWITLIQALAARPGGPPHVRITGIDDPVSEYARGDGLQLVGKMLSEMSDKFKIPLEFNPLSVYGPQVTREMLDIRPGEALAVNFTLQLHHTPDESVDVDNPRDGLLRMVKGLSPKVTTLVEQESNTNTTPFLTRFVETFEYYYAMFESIDVTLPRDSKERISVEQHCLAKDIVNIIACEGKDRVERHELLGKWRSRFTMAGFKPYPLSPYVNSVIKTLLGYYSDKYTLVDKDGVLLLGWKNRNLISASAWH